MRHRDAVSHSTQSTCSTTPTLCSITCKQRFKPGTMGKYCYHDRLRRTLPLQSPSHHILAVVLLAGSSVVLNCITSFRRSRLNWRFAKMTASRNAWQQHLLRLNCAPVSKVVMHLNGSYTPSPQTWKQRGQHTQKTNINSHSCNSSSWRLSKSSAAHKPRWLMQHGSNQQLPSCNST